jgi:predicted RNase H-like nuclease (RuvC/YqgF family)
MAIVVTQIKQRIEELIPEPYHKLAFNFLNKLKQLDKNMCKLQNEIEKLPNLTYSGQNGNQTYQKKHPALETYETQLKLYNSTVKELMNYLRNTQIIEGKPSKEVDEFTKQMEKFDNDFQS